MTPLSRLLEPDDRDDAQKQLMAKFKFSDKQAVAILEMKLQSPAQFGEQKVEDELKEKQKLIKERFAGAFGRPEETFESGEDELLAIRKNTTTREEDESGGASRQKRCPTKGLDGSLRPITGSH